MSRRTGAPGRAVISACRRETPGSSTRRSASLPRPITVVWRPSGYDVVPMTNRRRRRCRAEGGRARRTEDRWGTGDRRLRLAAHPEDAGLQRVVVVEQHVDAAQEGVPLVLGVLAHHVGQLPAQRVGVHGQPLVVVGGQLHVEDVGDDGPAAAHHGGPVVHLALQRRGDLDRLHLGLEGAREGAVDQLVEPLLEPVQQSHGPSRPGVVARAQWRGSGDSTARPGTAEGAAVIVTADPATRTAPAPGRASLIRLRARVVTGALGAREWRNRQTRTVQVRVPVRAWGFNSPLAHDNLGALPARAPVPPTGALRLPSAATAQPPTAPVPRPVAGIVRAGPSGPVSGVCAARSAGPGSWHAFPRTRPRPLDARTRRPPDAPGRRSLRRQIPRHVGRRGRRGRSGGVFPGN